MFPGFAPGNIPILPLLVISCNASPKRREFPCLSFVTSCYHPPRGAGWLGFFWRKVRCWDEQSYLVGLVPVFVSSKDRSRMTHTAMDRKRQKPSRSPLFKPKIKGFYWVAFTLHLYVVFSIGSSGSKDSRGNKIEYVTITHLFSYDTNMHLQITNITSKDSLLSFSPVSLWYSLLGTEPFRCLVASQLDLFGC